MDKSRHILQLRLYPAHMARVRRWVAGLAITALVFEPFGSTLALAHDTEKVGNKIGVPQIVTREPQIAAESASLIDVQSGRVLYERQPDKRMRIASLTKIITAWIAVRSGKLDAIVTASDRAVRQEGSSIYLARGEKQTLRDLTYAMMLRSGNDAATAIAEFLGGSTEKFADIMNAEVRKLGLTHSHFMNPHGLDHDQHYSTAHDMAVITATALKNPTFAAIVSTKYYSIPWQGQKWDRKMKNKNKLLWMLPGASGVKTGYTKKAGRCLASALTRDGRQVALVVLRDGQDWVDSAHLLTYGITAFDRRNICDIAFREFHAPVRFGQKSEVKVVPSGHLVYPLHQDETAAIEVKTVHIDKLSAPIRVGKKAGEVVYFLHGQKIGSLPLVTAETVDAKGFFGRLREWIMH